MKKVRVSEMFSSFQGEGMFIGTPSLWIRFFGCNLTCDGFGQKDPSDPSSYILPYETFDITSIKSIEELPVFAHGCDSSYSWSHRFKHLIKELSVDEIISTLKELGKTTLGINLTAEDGVEGWFHPITQTKTQLCFTGGEPMLHQKSISDILASLKEIDSLPPMVTIETNATKPIKSLDVKGVVRHVHMSCSPKLASVSGEVNAFSPEIIKSYVDHCDSGVIKIVHNGSEDAWSELSLYQSFIRYMVLNEGWKAYIMPVGSTVEDQTSDKIASIALEAMRRGYMISPRAHVQVFGNVIGS